MVRGRVLRSRAAANREQMSRQMSPDTGNVVGFPFSNRRHRTRASNNEENADRTQFAWRERRPSERRYTENVDEQRVSYAVEKPTHTVTGIERKRRILLLP